MLDMQELINNIKKEEGVVKENGLHVMYFDHLGNPTIGHGTLISAPGGIPDHIAYDLLLWKLNNIMEEMDQHILWWRGEGALRQAALVQMAYQLGVGGLLGFKKMLWCMEHGRYKQAAAEALDSLWARQTPKRARRVALMIREGWK